MIDALAHALAMAFGMGWEILWPLILGFFLSAIVQAVVSHSEMSRLLPDDRPRSIATALALGAASSSCSYAAVALARSLFRKGANFTAAMAFEQASTNLVAELSIIMLILLGWQLTLAEFIGAPIMSFLASAIRFATLCTGSEAEIVILRHQLDLLQRRAPRRPHLHASTIGMIANGRYAATIPSTTAKSENNSHSTGVCTIPRLISALLPTPCRPSTRRHAKARTRPLVKIGMVNSASRSAARRGPLKRPTTVAAGTARSVETVVVSAARPAVRRKTVVRPFSRRAA
jgi:Predicted permease